MTSAAGSRSGSGFSTGLSVSLVVVALALQSPILVFALSGIGVVASFAARHPFDYLWHYGVRHLFGAPVLPPNVTPTNLCLPSETFAWLERRRAPGGSTTITT